MPQLNFSAKQAGRQLPGTAERNALIAIDYQSGMSAKDLGAKYNLDPTYACAIGRAICGHRKAPREGRRQNRMSLYFSQKEKFYIKQAAEARGITPGSLASRVLRTCASDPTLFDNILDDGVQTPRGQS